MKSLTTTEIKILHLIKNIPTVDKYIGFLRKKTDLDYSYLCKLLKQLADRRIVKRITPPGTRKVFYDITKKGKELIK